MALAIVGTPTSGTSGGASSISFAFDATGCDLIVVGVGVTDGSVTIDAATFNAVSMTAVDAGQSTGSGQARARMFALASPASGSHNVVVTLSAGEQGGAGCVGFSGSNTTTPVRAGSNTGSTGPAGAPSCSVTSQAGDIVIDASACRLADGNFTTPGAGQTEQMDFSMGGGAFTMTTANGAASVTMTETFNNAASVAQSAFSVAAAGAAPSGDFGGPSSPLYRVRLRSY